MTGKILVIGAAGQIGIELVSTLREKHGASNVIATDLRRTEIYESDPYFQQLDALDRDAMVGLITSEEIKEVYLLAAMLSASAEKFPQKAWNLNINSLLLILDLAKEGLIDKIFWPSSIAVFGPNSPKVNTPQKTIKDPNTVYGMSKSAGELWCSYYFEKYGVDVRSIRYPGLIGHASEPGGGTTDYAVTIFHEAIKSNKFECYLNPDSTLPMMYMSDAIRATINIMSADKEDIKIRESYNLAGVSFSPEEIAAEIMKHIPDFEITYNPDFRVDIADSWPRSIDDHIAQDHWNWHNEYDLQKMVKDMIKNLRTKYATPQHS